MINYGTGGAHNILCNNQRWPRAIMHMNYEKQGCLPSSYQITLLLYFLSIYSLILHDLNFPLCYHTQDRTIQVAHSVVNLRSMLPHNLELLKVHLELGSEALEIDEELVEVIQARYKKNQKPRLVWYKP